MPGKQLHRISGRDVIVWRARLKDEIPGSGWKGNPMLWWAQEKDSRDHLVCGVPTKRECLALAKQELEASR